MDTPSRPDVQNASLLERERRLALPLGIDRLLGNVCHTYLTCDPAGRVTAILNCKPDGTPLCYFEYDYDAASRITSIRREAGIVVYYSYDNADRLADPGTQYATVDTCAVTW